MKVIDGVGKASLYACLLSYSFPKYQELAALQSTRSLAPKEEYIPHLCLCLPFLYFFIQIFYAIKHVK